ncbi:MFS transporter [Streptomyces xanthophaeus]|uniref:MFS transporter n=1 Tax=Streptomyces xanthophaeus TaxID=67385 RepID=UPI00399014BB
MTGVQEVAAGVRPAATGTGRARARTVIALCFAVLVFDGYDLIVYGAVLPELLQHEPWALTPAQAGAIGSYAAAGMLVGALAAGALTGLVGRRRIMLLGVAWFSLSMAACALATSAATLGLYRALGGVGLGAVMPVAVALTAEHCDPRRRGRTNALMFSGYSFGGILAAALALWVLPAWGFRAMFAVGLAPLLILPLLARHLPDQSATGTLPAADEGGRAAAPPRGGSYAALRRPPHRLPALLFALISFVGLLLVYGLNTWLPQIMRAAGYPLTDSLVFLVVLNAGAIAGTLAGGALGDRVGMRPVIAAAFCVAAGSVLLLSAVHTKAVLLALVALAGFGTIGTQILVNGHVAAYFPAHLRTQALGWTLGLGRLGAIAGPAFGGFLAARGVAPAWNFYAFAVPAALAAVLTTLLPARPGANGTN